MYETKDNIVELDIGGTHKLTTTRSTLCTVPDSALATMFSGRHQLTLHNGRVFIDRDGKTFKMILNYLRSMKLPLFDHKSIEAAFYEELDFWGIPLFSNNGQNEDAEGNFFDPSWIA
jgi:hypothetical protein